MKTIKEFEQENEIPKIDLERIAIFDQMKEEQRAAFLVGMSFFSAFNIFLKKTNSGVLTEDEEVELLVCQRALNKLNLKSVINS